MGLVQFKHTDIFDSFPTEKRRDAQLASFFHERGVDASHIVYLQDKQATLSAINSAFKTLLGETAPGDTLMLYYEGHGHQVIERAA